MFTIESDKTINVTRGDILYFSVMAEDNGVPYTFKAGDIVRISVYGKKDCENVVLQKDFPVTTATEEVEIYLTKGDTKIGEIINKQKDYWYEIELNPDTAPQTIIGYDDDGAKVFRLYPEGEDIEVEEEEILPEDIPVVDSELSLYSDRPVKNKVIARAVLKLDGKLKETTEKIGASEEKLTKKIETAKTEAISEACKVRGELEAEKDRWAELITSSEYEYLTADQELYDLRHNPWGTTEIIARAAVTSQYSVLNEAMHQMNNISKQFICDEAVAFSVSKGYINIYGNESASTGIRGGEDLYTGFIPVQAYDFITIHVYGAYGSNNNLVAYYDASQTFLSYINTTGKIIYVMPTVNGYIRLSCRGISRPRMLITRRKTLVDNSHILADFHKPNYEYVPFSVLKGYVAETGVINSPEAFSRDVYTEYLPVKPGEKYFLVSRVNNTYGKDTRGDYHWFAVNTFDSEKNHISQLVKSTITEESADQTYTATAEFTIPNGVDYIVISTRTYNSCTMNLARAIEEPNTDSVVKSVALRGYSIGAPENTLPAYKLAKKKGFNYAECDVAFTSDGIGVLLQYNTIDRTSNGTGAVAEKTLEELKALDFGSWFSEDYSGTTIPTFEEFISLCRGLGLHPYINLKFGTKEQVQGLHNIVTLYNMQKKVTWISSYKTYLEYIKEFDSKARLGVICGTVTDATISIATSLLSGENEVFIDSNSPALAGVINCIVADLPLEARGINDRNAIISLNPYVSGVTSDSLIAENILRNNLLNE